MDGRSGGKYPTAGAAHDAGGVPSRRSTGDRRTMPSSNYPQIFATLGMVIGLYGILSFEVERDPKHGWLIAAVDITGKSVGPFGLADLILTGQWPLTSGTICPTSDLIWWIPFAACLRDGWSLSPVAGRGRLGPTLRSLVQ